MLLTLGMNAQSEKSIKKTSIWHRNQSYQPTGYGTIHVVIFFREGSCSIDRNQLASMEAIANYMYHTQHSIRVIGETHILKKDSRSSDLSILRARAVKQMLVEKYKIDANRIEVVGIGGNYDVAPNSPYNNFVRFVEVKD